MPCTVGVFFFAIGTLLELDLVVQQDALLQRNAFEFGAYRNTNLQSHRVGFRPYPNRIDNVQLGRALDKGRDAFQTDTQQLGGFQVAGFVTRRSPGVPTALTTLMNNNKVVVFRR